MGRVSEARAAAALAPLRARIDAIDAAMVDLLAERFRTVEDVVEVKRREALPARLDDRVEDVVRRVRGLAEAKDCPADLADQVWRSMIEWIIAFEDHRLTGLPEAKPE